VLPLDLPPDAIDIIDGLLNSNISERYGCGPIGSKNDIKALKAHPFFKDINFNTLTSTNPPVQIVARSFVSVAPRRD
jgi:3-phosphoinositide dependent protein kinase-1